MDKNALISSFQGKVSPKVLKAFEQVAREEFCVAELKKRAYDDKPLPILRGKTISQPSTVMYMTEHLEVDKSHKVLEIGSGSGYQSAILSKLANKVVSVEVVPELVRFARDNLKKAGIQNVEVVEHDGSQGYEEQAPYDRIIVTAASPKVLINLSTQLKEGGIMIVPVGDLSFQQMVKVVKHKNHLEKEHIGEFVFSPLVGKYGFDEERVA